MSIDTREAIRAVRIRRMHKAVLALELALSEGRAVSQELLQVSGLLERGIDPRQIRSTFSDLPRLIEAARAIEARQSARPDTDANRAPRRIHV